MPQKLDAEITENPPPSAFPNGCHIAEIEIDPDTGILRVDRYTIVDPRQVFRPAVQIGAASVVLAHNHPSGDPTPSEQDVQVTRRVAQAGEVMEIRLLDHIIVGNRCWTSLADSGDLASPDWL